MKNCFTVSDNITKSLMWTTNFLWANCPKKSMGVFLDWLNARIFLWPFFIKLATIRSIPFKFSSAMIVLFILLFFSLFPSLSFFTSFYFLIFFGGGTCVISVFFSVLLLDGILAKKFVMPNFFCIGWVSFGFTKSVFVVCDHDIDAVFSVFTRGEIVTFKSFCLTKGFFIRDKQILYYSRQH